MLIKPRNSQLRDWTRTLVSKSTDHSISDQECQWGELLNVLELIMWPSREWERMLWDNNGTSTEYPRPLRITNGSLTHLISKVMVDPQIWDAQLPTQDGGNYSDTKMQVSSTKKERFLISKDQSMPKTETSLSMVNTERSTNNGTSFTLMNGKVIQRKENWIKTLVFMLKEISTSFHNWKPIDTWT